MRARVLQALRDVVPDLPEEVAARVEVTPAREAAHGDMATNAALVAAKAARRKPQDIAASLVAALQADTLVAGADVGRARASSICACTPMPGAACCR